MTVTTQANKTIALGNGVVGPPGNPFTFNFIGVDADVIHVIYTDAAGVETELLSSQYTLVLNSALPGQLWGVGGSVTYPLVGSPIASGTTLTIYRELDLEQLVSLANQASYGQYATSAERMGDLIEMQLQQVDEKIARALQMSITNGRAPISLPPAAQMAGKALIGSADGLDVIAGEIPAGGVISSAMQPVVSAASLAAGRTAFGLRQLAEYDIGAGLEDDGSNAIRVNFGTSQVASNQAIAAASHLVQFMATGPINFTLARANTLWDGFGFWVHAFADAVTLIPDANDSIRGRASGEAFPIPAGSAAWVTTDAANSGIWTISWMPLLVPVFQCQLAKVSSNLVLSRFGGRAIFINGINETIPVAGVSHAPTGAAPNTNYYIYTYMNGVTMEMERDVTVPATSPIYGHRIKTGDGTRSLVGFARAVTGPAFADTATQRFVRSWYNDPGSALANFFTTLRAITATIWTEINTEIRCEFLCWSAEVPSLAYTANISGSNANMISRTSIGIDGTNAEDCISQLQYYANTAQATCAGVLEKSGLSEGYHYATLLGEVTINTATYGGFAATTTGTYRTSLKGLLKR